MLGAGSGVADTQVLDIPLHLLVIDDQEQGRESCASMARAQGFRVSTARDGVSALQILEGDPVDIDRKSVV